jgi:hypothetical protein
MKARMTVVTEIAVLKRRTENNIKMGLYNNNICYEDKSCKVYPRLCLVAQFVLTDAESLLHIIIIIILLGISFMQGIYTYIPETNHVPREHCVATILM